MLKRLFFTLLILSTLFTTQVQASIALTIGTIASFGLEEDSWYVTPELICITGYSFKHTSNMFRGGDITWAAFWLVLDEQSQIKLNSLSEADEDERNACLEIIYDDSLSVEEKQFQCESL